MLHTSWKRLQLTSLLEQHYTVVMKLTCREPECEISPQIPRSVRQLQRTDIIIVQPHVLSMHILSPFGLQVRCSNARPDSPDQVAGHVALLVSH